MLENKGEIVLSGHVSEDYTFSKEEDLGLQYMKRTITAIALSTVVLLSLSAHAQRAMAGRSMGSMGGRAVAPARPAAPARMAPGGMAPGRVGPARIAPSRGVAVRRPFANHVVITTGFPFHSPFFGRCFGVPCRNRFFFSNPFLFGAGFGYPYYGYIPGFDTPYAGSAPEQQPVVAPENGNDIQTAVALQRLSDQVESMREEQYRQARSSGASISAHQPDGAATFVFRDGRRLVTQNYAIAGQTLWILSEHTARKVSLADLDARATDQVNAANGIDLHIPETN